MEGNRRNIPQAFFDAVRAALKVAGKKHDGSTVEVTTKLLYVHQMIELKDRHGKWVEGENPHYMGRNIDKLGNTVKGEWS